MALFSSTFSLSIITLFLLSTVSAKLLSPHYYAKSCPRALPIILKGVTTAMSIDRRMGASLLRLHFHDCFVTGCDASILLDDTANFTGEKTASQNGIAIRGFEVIDNIKSELELACPRVVSCADIIAVAARDSVVNFGGPSWIVPLGRRDSTNASLDEANAELAAPTAPLTKLKATFLGKGFTVNDMVALSGAHTVGKARCTTFRDRLYNETNINSSFAASMKQECPLVGGDDNLSPLDETTSNFDNTYFRNLIELKGVLHTDQQLYNNASTTASKVKIYSKNMGRFFHDFANAMVKTGNLSPLTGSNGEIRTNCRKINES